MAGSKETRAKKRNTNPGAKKNFKGRDYKLEYERDQKKRKKYRASLRKKRVEKGLTSKDGYANGNGGKHISHVKPARGKAGGKTRVEAAKTNLKRQPKRTKK